MMSISNPAHAALFFLFFFSMASFKLCCCMRNNTIACPQIEKQSLLNFKQSLLDPNNRLTSWGGEVNCCQWEGVVCNNLTGHVHELNVHGLSGKINPSLLNLSQLRFLDLSQNEFGQTIPSFIGSFTNLEYLNLSGGGFHGIIPHNIGNLSNLHTLVLRGDVEFVKSDKQGTTESLLSVDSLEWLSGLSQLKYLNMNGVNLTKATNWAQVINTLPSLLELHCRFCSLDFSSTPLSGANVTSLSYLDLSANYAKSFAIPKWIFQLSNLVYLDLKFNFLEGPIPTISNSTKLHYIDLSINNLNSSIPDWLYLCKDLEFFSLNGNDFLHGAISDAIANLTSLNTLDLGENQFSGKIPRGIGNLCKIQWLYLSFNNLQGDISDSFGNMAECFLEALQFLSLHRNQLSGHITDQFGEFKNLQMLDLKGNSLSDAIPVSIGKLSSLKYLVLSDNKLTGNIPESLCQLFNLQSLDIGNNMLQGVVTEVLFANLSLLNTFSASGNHLTLKVSPNWIPPFQLRTLELGSWNLGVSQIPSWIETQRNIKELDLSNTGISGSVPSWFWEIQLLNLSHNHLLGKIPFIGGTENEGSQYMYLSSNQFSGPLPRIGDIVRELDLSNNSFSGGITHFLCDMTNKTYGLEILHLGGNQLSGELPDCWMKWPSLRFLSLGNNNMSGSIPNSVSFLADLRSVNLYSNRFSGQIPFAMHNCTRLVKIDLSDNDLDGNIPPWMGTSLDSLRILILRSNNLSGKISPEICQLNSLQILDLSDNKFSDRIPRCVYNFTAMATKRSLPGQDFGNSDYSYSIYTGAFVESATVAIKGSELQYDRILPLVNVIDLSKNNLSGDIPKELTRLVELKSLNLSENHLAGLIPESIGNMKQLESLDLSRNSLSSQIPNGFTLVSSLNHLNLSYNNLTGKIPESTQLLSLDASSFIGNNLCGPPLTSKCNHDGDEVPGHKEDNEDGRDKPKIEWFYVFLSLGYAVGFSVVCTTLVLKKSWRKAYFELLECMWNKLYVYVYIKLKGLTKPISRSGPSP